MDWAKATARWGKKKIKFGEFGASGINGLVVPITLNFIFGKTLSFIICYIANLTRKQGFIIIMDLSQVKYSDDYDI